MCMNTVYSKSEKEEYLASFKLKWIPVTKIVRKGGKRYFAQFYTMKFKAGVNRCRIRGLFGVRNTLIANDRQQYTQAMHFYTKNTDTTYKMNKKNEEAVLICYVRKEWITDIGTNWITDEIIIIARKAIFPPYGFTKLTDEEKKKYGIIQCA